ncbi:MAG: hypothetical protein ACM3YM_01295 [Sphingomonadales bacterium]
MIWINGTFGVGKTTTGNALVSSNCRPGLVPLVAGEVTTVTGEDFVVDTTDLAPAEVVSAIVASVPAERVTA